MTVIQSAYFTAFKNLAFTRTPSGVLTLRFHTDNGPATFTGQMHTDLPRALYEIGDDRDNRVLVLTGTGDQFMADIDGPSLGDITKPAAWDRTIAEGRRVMQRLVDLEMPIVAAVNGPATVHSEYVLLADIVIAAGTAGRPAAVADPLSGGHRAAASQSPDGRGHTARHGTGRPERSRPCLPAALTAAFTGGT